MSLVDEPTDVLRKRLADRQEHLLNTRQTMLVTQKEIASIEIVLADRYDYIKSINGDPCHVEALAVGMRIKHKRRGLGIILEIEYAHRDSRRDYSNVRAAFEYWRSSPRIAWVSLHNCTYAFGGQAKCEYEG